MKRQTSFGHRAAALLGAVALMLFACPAALGQAGTSSVRGTVLDAQGGAVAGATVTLTNVETNTTRTQTTNTSGTYGFDLITPGQYRLEAEATGFKKAAVTNVAALVAKQTEVNVQLEVGNVTETVTVSAGAGEVLLNTQDASIGNNFVTQQITQLPLEARNVTSLLTLQPGVTREGYVSGARNDQSNVTLDGIDINEQQTNQLGGAATGGSGSDYLTSDATESPSSNTVLRLNAEAVEEFRVVTSNPNATFGRSSGAQISLVTKSGTNDFHGSLFEYHRNTIFTSNDFFNNAADVPRPKLIRNTFGGAFGGPVKRDRAFFFYSYEGRRDASERSVLQTVPLPSLGRGEVRFPNASGNLVTITPAQFNALFPVLGQNPAALAVLADAARRYPSNSTEAGDEVNTAGFRFNAPISTNLNAHTARFDFNLTKSGSQQLFARITTQYDLFGEAPAFPDTPAPSTWSHPWGVVAGHTWAISNNKTNVFRYGLTRQAFSAQGDAAENTVFFRFVYTPLNFTNTLSRVTPTHNITDDFSWTKGNHTIQFGTNLRFIENRRTDSQLSYDYAVINPFYYEGSGRVLSDPIVAAGFTIQSGFADSLRTAVAAVLGRYSDYGATFNFDLEGNLLPAGQPIQRVFATEEYDFYVQDVFRVRPNFTITAGLRYGISKPVYEKQGYMVTPNIPLGEYLNRRLAAAAEGQNYTEPIILNLAGEVHGRPGFYETDWNNFQPRVAFSWSPDFKGGLMGKLFGSEGRSVIRGGFAIVNDYFGQQLAVQFNANNELGFSSSSVISANTFDVTDNRIPRFTGFGQDVRGFPELDIPTGRLTFPQQRESDGVRRIESSLDSNLVSPIHYTWNFSYGRTLPKGLFVEGSYVGRMARNLLVGRDAAQPNLNFTDPASGMTWREAAGMLEGFRRNNTPISAIPRIPFFENLWAAGHIGDVFFGDPTLSNTQAVYGIAAINAPGCGALGGCYANGNDWTFTQHYLDRFTDNAYFYQPQYGALAVYSTIGSSDYHAGSLTVRQRFGTSLMLDFNYTLSKSMDLESNPQTTAAFTSFLFDASDVNQQRSVSDFDVRHVINANGIWQLPIGRGRWLNTDSGFANAVIGDWQLSGIFRWNSGLPVSAPLDFGGWPTNWNRRNMTVLTQPLESSPTRGGNGRAPNLFSNPEAAYRSFRSAGPGESGSRNVLRYPGYVVLDMGLAKSWSMPWSEGHKLQIRWDVFNVTNTQRLTAINEWVQGTDPQLSSPQPNWGDLVRIQGTPRVMQFGFRYSF